MWVQRYAHAEARRAEIRACLRRLHCWVTMRSRLPSQTPIRAGGWGQTEEEEEEEKRHLSQSKKKQTCFVIFGCKMPTSNFPHPHVELSSTPSCAGCTTAHMLVSSISASNKAAAERRCCKGQHTLLSASRLVSTTSVLLIFHCASAGFAAFNPLCKLLNWLKWKLPLAYFISLSV